MISSFRIALCLALAVSMVSCTSAANPLIRPSSSSGALSCSELAGKATGMSLEELQTSASKVGVLVRVLRQDGEQFMGTKDYRLERLNIELSKNRVVVARCG